LAAISSHSIGLFESVSLNARLPASVIAGLDPTIHPLAKKMDARVEPGHDDYTGVGLDLH
jgi:hypothetical protein